jgi:hypothetical protein
MKRKFKKGIPLTDIFDLLFVVMKGSTVWYKDKPLNAEFVINMSVKTIQKNIDKEYFYYCEEVE